MKPADAIEWLNEMMPEWDYEANLYCSEPFMGLGEYVCTEPEGYVFKAAIEALEKQIPKVPNYSGDGYYGGELLIDTWERPCCGYQYEVGYDYHEYCPKCGQHIDHSTLTEDD